MQILLMSTKDLNKKNSVRQWSFSGIYKKRKKVGQVLETKAKKIGVSDQWSSPGIKDSDFGEIRGVEYGYRVIAATEDVDVNVIIDDLEDEVW